MLERISEHYPDADYVLLFLEDFFLKARVDTTRVIELAGIARDRGIGCLRLAANLPLALPPTYELPDVPGVGVIASGEPYRVTLQVAVWRIQTLRRLLAPGLSAWEFEQIGSQMSEGFDDAIWGVRKPAIEYDHAIEKGKWKPAGLAILKEAGLDLSGLSRGVFSEEELAAHFDRSREESEVTGYRSAALRCFLVGRRTEGLRYIWRRLGVGNPSLIDLVLSLIGLLGIASTQNALRVYVRLRLWSYARRERGRSRIVGRVCSPKIGREG